MHSYKNVETIVTGSTFDDDDDDDDNTRVQKVSAPFFNFIY